MATLLIQNGRVISPEDGIDDKLDVLIENGVIRRIGSASEHSASETLDAEGCVVSPGFIDLHVHLREPGGEESETLETGLGAAVAGGFTAVCAMPNTRPVIDHPGLVRAMIERAARLGLARVFPVAAASSGSEGEALTDFHALARAGAVAFSDDGKPLKTARLMQRALETARALEMPIIDHCEDPGLSGGGSINAGPVAERLQLKGIPAASEDVCVARDLVLAAATGARLHVAHLSTSGAAEMVRAAKRKGVRATCEVTPHHFTLTEDAVLVHGAIAKMNPPLRGAGDRDALRAAFQDGTIDAIATDHAPHEPALQAQPIAQAPFGIIGLETALGLAITQLLDPGFITLPSLVELMSSRPARIIGKPLGTVGLGRAADITIFDPARRWTYHVADGRSKSRNSPFDGWEIKGKVIATIVAGKLVYRERDHEPLTTGRLRTR
ncbi:MAG: dihydroorotase [Terriglobia bacterium]